MENLNQGYVPPVGVTIQNAHTGTTITGNPGDMFVVAPSLDKKGAMNVADMKDYMADYAELDRVAKLVKEKQDAIKQTVHEGLKALGMTSATTEYGKFTIVPENKGERFDAKSFQAESPKIYKLYTVPSVKKEYLKVTPTKKK